MKYNYTTCHPNKSEIVKYDRILSKDEVVNLFIEYPWKHEQSIFNRMKKSQIHYSPSLEIINCSDTNNGICFSVVGPIDKIKFLVFSGNEQSKEIRKEEALHFLDLFLTQKNNQLNKELKSSYKGYVPETNNSKGFPKWLKSILNLILIMFFGGVAIAGYIGGLPELVGIAGCICLLYITAFVYFVIKTD